jgi:alpha-beta hydrolase superfamily lysophospholipase
LQQNQSIPMVSAEKNPHVEDIVFAADGLALKGTLHLPSAHRPPVIIGSHGLLSSRNSPKQVALAHQCNRLQMAFFRFDHRGCGDSRGKLNQTTLLEDRCRDLIRAIELMKTRGDIGERIGLFGSSMGGTVCLSVASRISITTLVIVAAPIRSRALGKAPVVLKKSPAQDALFEEEKNQFDISDQISGIRNILILHGQMDDLVPVSAAREIYNRVGNPKCLIIQKGGDHRMSDPVHQEEFIREASLWFKTALIGR